MTTITAGLSSGMRLRVPTLSANVLSVALRELREAVRSRWFLLYTLGFAALGLGVSYASSASAGGAGLSGFGRTTAGLVNLVLLVVPLMALTAGAGTIASDRERGMLVYLLSQPVSRLEVLLGKYVGLGAALLACICLGLGSCAGILAWKGDATRPLSMVWLAGLSFGLALGMLSVGMLASVLARKASVAVGTAIFLWLALVFVSDLALMAGTMALKLRIEELLAMALVNPLQVFKMWSLHAIDSSLDVLGPAGLYAVDEYGGRLHLIFGACLMAWVVAPLALAAAVFSRRAPV
ncbi:MAG: ABC transporter permease subunit [Phycisphaeraceae bacterium]|nr:ABC transporter permease subunit [Phycisphaeraceae bacterium]